MQNLCGKLAALGVLSGLAFAGGCASPVPGQAAGGSGKSLLVTIQCYGPMNPQYYYYFLINRYTITGQQQARGPVPVIQGGIAGSNGYYGNGFATGSQNNGFTVGNQVDYGITDYVLFNQSVSANQIGLYQINGSPDEPNPGGVVPASNVIATLPDPNIADGQPSTVLSFRLYLSQLVTDTTVPADIATEVQNMHWLQVNIVATDNVPTSQTGLITKNVDSMGNSLQASQLSSFLVIDLTQNTTVTSNQSIGTLTAEPQNDVYPCGTCNPSIDLQYWSIQVSP